MDVHFLAVDPILFSAEWPACPVRRQKKEGQRLQSATLVVLRDAVSREYKMTRPEFIPTPVKNNILSKLKSNNYLKK